MLSKILGGFKDKNSALSKAIAKMNLTDMRTYINDRVPDSLLCEDGLNEVMKRLVEVDKKSSKRYIEIDDMDSKKKKGFDLVLAILDNKKITIVTLESVNKFLELYEDIIDDYDNKNKQIYSSKLRDAVEKALKEIDAKAELGIKMKVVG